MPGKLRKIIFSIILFFIPSVIFSQVYKIDYYGIVSTQIDSNMSKMTSDLYYTQLTEINNFSVEDKRNGSTVSSQEPAAESFSEGKLSFYALISKDEKTEKWTSVFKVVDKSKDEEHSKLKTYDSFYKILMEPKSVLQETIKNLIEKDSNAVAIQKSADNQESSRGGNIESTEVLSGTWAGESTIDKIVILRGGRGFVIFKNGASMNIGIELTNVEGNQNIVITQKGRSNASFYPELPRNIALNAALSADPISWTLTALDGDTLTGTKNTLVQKGDDYETGSLQVEWKRIN
ncbi:MAG: hypothetical protein IJ530_07285 [Treponema sp.]|uniref:TP0183 family DNA metabolism protein n=1 Tax=Treponema sp. TaxID=166 RepID=UPI0025CD1009|nr:hypothetical protein [Treponema sp.]MBQ8679550.1 hypothetical protein [Treponema sp.]